MCGSETACSSRGPPALTYPPLGTSQCAFRMQDAPPCAILRNLSCGASIGPKGTTAGAGKMAFGQPVIGSGGDEIYAGFTGPGVTRLITRNPAICNVARQMRAAVLHTPRVDSPLVVVGSCSRSRRNGSDRIGSQVRAGRQAAPACNWDNQASPAPDKSIAHGANESTINMEKITTRRNGAPHS